MTLDHLRMVVVRPHLSTACLAFYMWKLDVQLDRIKGMAGILVLKPWLRSGSLFWSSLQLLGK